MEARCWAALALSSLALAAALVDLGSIHTLEQGDSIVPVLVSLQRWTPMYWGQERYGMLVPLLALPFRDPLVNLLVQRGLLIFAGLASVVLLARYALPRRSRLLAGLLGAGTLLVLMPAPWLFEYLGNQPYGLSAALGIGGLILLEPPAPGAPARPARLASAAALCLLSHWINAAAGLFLGPVVLARAAAGWFEREPGLRARLLVELGVLGLGMAAGQASIWLYPYVTGYPLRLDLGTAPPAEWVPRTGVLLVNSLRGVGPAWPLALGAAATGLLLPWFRGGPEGSTASGWGTRRRALLGALVMVVAALSYALATAPLRWLEANQFHWRYLATSIVLVHLAGFSLLAEPIARWRQLVRPAMALALLLVPVAAVLAYGPPSLARVRADLDVKLGTWTEDVLAARCDLVAGDYWTVWPAVWHAGWIAHQRGVPRPYGITHRTNPTVRYWSGRPREELRICRVRGDEAQAERWMRAFHLWPVRELEERSTVVVVRPAEDAGE